MDTPLVAMILRSGWVARVILIILACMSVMAWAVIFNRLFYYGALTKGNKKFKKLYDTMTRLSDVEKIDKTLERSSFYQLAKAATAEHRRVLEDARSHTGVKDWSFFLESQFAITAERIDTCFSVLATKLDYGIILLAIAASASPFFGLFGTVWGIMDSFFEIGRQGSASLPVVAPGIAEALIVTAIGLAAAIPAVIFYNYFSHRAELIERGMDEFRIQLFARLKREIIALLYSDNKTAGKQADA
ncbi:MAG: MotA/TolQ/ExbB proton channel family protein [Chitinivibrionales bacterium]|nr:MotA/TolQ/ExbB proton channel family protein [Chitinivibrionales bacterium]